MQEIYRTEHMGNVTMPHLAKVFINSTTLTCIIFGYAYNAIHKKRKASPLRFIVIKTMELDGNHVSSNYEFIDVTDQPEHSLAAEYRAWEATLPREEVA